MKKLLIVGLLFFSSLSYSTNYATDGATQEVEKDQKMKYDERKDWIENRKNELISLCNKLINMYDFPKTNVEKERDKVKLKVRMYVKEIKSIDYADDKKFEGIQKKFESLESYIKSCPQKIRERELKIVTR